MSSGQKDGGLSAAVMCSAVMCPAAKWVDTLLCMSINACLSHACPRVGPSRGGPDLRDDLPAVADDSLLAFTTLAC